MALSREMREAFLTVLSPVPYLVGLLPILSYSADVSPTLFLLVFTLVVTFLYLMIVRSVSLTRSNLAKRKDNVPATHEYDGATYLERFVSISKEALFGVDSEVEPITDYSGRPPFPYLVYAFWGSVASILVFLSSALLLAWFVNSGNLDSLAEIPVSTEVVQNLPLGSLNLLLVLLPVFGELSFENRVFVGGTVFITGFFFLTAARNLTVISDDVHRRVLRFLVTKNPITENELVNAVALMVVYGLLLSVS